MSETIGLSPQEKLNTMLVQNFATDSRRKRVPGLRFHSFLQVSNEVLGIKTKIFKCLGTVIFTTYIFLYTLTYKYFPGQALLGILGGVVTTGSTNPDHISDQKCHFPHPFLCHHYLDENAKKNEKISLNFIRLLRVVFSYQLLKE